MASWYAILGLAPGASRHEIQRAYRTLAKVWHPDRLAADVTQQQYALEHFHRLSEAYQALCQLESNRATSRPAPATGWRRLQGRRCWSLMAVCLSCSALLALSLGLWPARSAPGLWAPVVLSAPDPHMPAESLSPRRYITVGSTAEEVLAIEGAPLHRSTGLWEYRASRLFFRAGRVTGWDIWPAAPLQVQLLPTVQLVPRPLYFTRGSSKDEVLTVQGTPTRLTEHVWDYGASRIFFIGNQVRTWHEWPGAPLMTKGSGALTGP